MPENKDRSSFFSSWAKAMKQIKNPHMDGKNPHFKSKFASLKSCTDAIKPALDDAGLIFQHEVKNRQVEERWIVSVRAVLYDTNGTSKCGDWLDVPARDGGAQSLGSATTYGRRYTLMSFFGIVGDDDDDGNDATESEKDKKTRINEIRKAMAAAVSAGQKKADLLRGISDICGKQITAADQVQLNQTISVIAYLQQQVKE